MKKRIVTLLLVLALALGSMSVPAAAEDETEGEIRYVSVSCGLYLRETADADAKIVAYPAYSYPVRVIGEEGEWSHVIFEANDGDYEGWCRTEYLTASSIGESAEAKTAETAETKSGIRRARFHVSTEGSTAVIGDDKTITETETEKRGKRHTPDTADVQWADTKWGRGNWGWDWKTNTFYWAGPGPDPDN